MRTLKFPTHALNHMEFKPNKIHHCSQHWTMSMRLENPSIFESNIVDHVHAMWPWLIMRPQIHKFQRDTYLEKDHFQGKPCLCWCFQCPWGETSINTCLIPLLSPYLAHFCPNYGFLQCCLSLQCAHLRHVSAYRCGTLACHTLLMTCPKQVPGTVISSGPQVTIELKAVANVAKLAPLSFT